MREHDPAAVRRLLALRQFPAFAGAELAELATIGENVVETTFPAGTIVAVPATRMAALHLILEGRIEARARHGTVASWGPHQIFGVLEVIAGRGISGPAIAVTSTHTLQLAGADFAEVIEDNFRLFSQTRRALAASVLAVVTLTAERGLRAPRRIEPPLVVPQTRPLGLVERLIVLRQQLPFARGRIQALAALAASIEELRVPAGATITRANDHADGAFVIIDGIVRARRADGPTHDIGAGSAIGSLEVLAEVEHSFTTQAVTPVRVLHCPAFVLFDVMEDHTDLALATIARLAGELLDVAGLVDLESLPALAAGHQGRSDGPPPGW